MSLIAKKYQIEHARLALEDVDMAYRVYRHKAINNQRCLILLHGAGVAAVDTWSPLLTQLNQWQYILLPDLRGMGETVNRQKEETPFSLEQLVQDITQLVTHLNWQSFDLGGYSLGGLVSMHLKQRLADKVKSHFVLEPALFDHIDWRETQRLRQRYHQIVESIKRGQTEDAVQQFLSLVSPQRKINPAADAIATTRLTQRSLGFAHALSALNRAAEVLDRHSLIFDQDEILVMAGGNSPMAMRQCHQQIASSHPNWRYIEVAGTDHSLPFQKPRQIAKEINLL